jgi:hypothetical protein
MGFVEGGINEDWVLCTEKDLRYNRRSSRSISCMELVN